MKTKGTDWFWVRWGRREWYFRIFGYGLYLRDTREHPLVFSEREGHRKYLRVGLWVLKVLTPNQFWANHANHLEIPTWSQGRPAYNTYAQRGNHHQPRDAAWPTYILGRSRPRSPDRTSLLPSTRYGASYSQWRNVHRYGSFAYQSLCMAYLWAQ